MTLLVATTTTLTTTMTGLLKTSASRDREFQWEDPTLMFKLYGAVASKTIKPNCEVPDTMRENGDGRCVNGYHWESFHYYA